MSVRGKNGGGARKVVFENTASKDEILDKAKSLFFIDKKCVFDNLNDMDINLGNFREEAVNDEHFTSLADYIKTTSFSKTRLYLLTKEKFVNQKVRDIATERVGCESPLSVLSDSVSVFDISSPNLRKFVFPTAASATEEELSEVDLPVHSLIGGSIERSIQKDECDRLFEESLEKDRQKNEELATLQSKASKIHAKEDEALKLQRIRKRRVPPEPTLAEDHVVLSVRHARKGTMR